MQTRFNRNEIINVGDVRSAKLKQPKGQTIRTTKL